VEVKVDRPRGDEEVGNPEQKRISLLIPMSKLRSLRRGSKPGRRSTAAVFE